MYVRYATDRVVSTDTVRGASEKAWLWTFQNNTRILEAQRDINLLHTCGGWFRSKVCREVTCKTPHKYTQRALWNFRRLGRQKISWTHLWLGLQENRGHVSMPEYVDHALIQFKHGTPRQAQDQPYQHTVPTYGARQQVAVAPDCTASLDKENKKLCSKWQALYFNMK